ncbi:GNAT family N-acetyltransferase [Rhizosphaericola mali]|uniref:GNAT family N-acetyltransferase n=1 Tax=Rhizosphaericola mali TaxID=2545455 RepID=A0A5P2G9Y2_9BACT|nr:GNAT family N-acetyltransferase [Rhizosphaericola mali]QES90510.1 GNAT family N-acetyltransferase [Rhizosphaericola mali]
MKDEISISNVSKEDLTSLVEVINDAYRTDNPNAWTTEAHLFQKDGIRMALPELEEAFANPNNIILKAVLSDSINVGTVSLTKKENELYLGTFAVSGNHQGLGIGKKLIQKAIEIAKDLDKSFITITVISTREELISWYKKLGFAPTGKIIPFEEDRPEHMPREPLNFIEMQLAL